MSTDCLTKSLANGFPTSSPIIFLFHSFMSKPTFISRIKNSIKELSQQTPTTDKNRQEQTYPSIPINPNITTELADTMSVEENTFKELSINAADEKMQTETDSVMTADQGPSASVKEVNTGVTEEAKNDPKPAIETKSSNETEIIDLSDISGDPSAGKEIKQDSTHKVTEKEKEDAPATEVQAEGMLVPMEEVAERDQQAQELEQMEQHLNGIMEETKQWEEARASKKAAVDEKAGRGDMMNVDAHPEREQAGVEHKSCQSPVAPSERSETVEHQRAHVEIVMVRSILLGRSFLRGKIVVQFIIF